MSYKGSERQISIVTLEAKRKWRLCPQKEKIYINHISDEYISRIYKELLQLNKNQFSSVAQLCLTLRPHGLQHTRLPCPSPTPEAYSNKK